ncbi:MAG: hypothetical protein IIX56_01105 [Treponema sp.]|nr:hypothetical protein [Treponema sp.]
MKKILTIFVAAAMLLGLASCSGDLHNDMDPAKVAMLQGEKKTFLDTADICGTVNGWTGAALNKVDETTYTYEFVADPTINDTNDGKLFKFSIREVAGSWTDGNRWCGDYDAEGGDAVHGVKVGEENTMVWSDKPDPSHFELRDTVPNTTYIITIKITDEDKKNLSVSFKADGDAPAASKPAPFYLDGYFFMGACLSPSGVWIPNLDYLLSDGAVDKEGNVLYALDFTAQNTSGWSCIQNKKGSLRYIGELTVGASDFIELASETNTMKSKEIKELVAGKAYRLEIKTTPEKKVYAKVYEILQYTVTLKVTGIAKTHIGKKGVIRGTWDSWAGKWTTAWKGKETTINKVSELKNAEVVADGDAAAMIVFTGLTSGVGAPDSEIEFKGCGYYGSVVADDIAKADGEIKVNGKDFEIKFKLAGDGNYTAVLNVEDNTIKTTKD